MTRVLYFESESTDSALSSLDQEKRPQLDGDEITAAFSVPRLMRLEHSLNQMAQSNTSLEKIYAEVRLGMEKQAEIQEDVGGPMAYAVITRAGFQRKE